MPEKRKPPIRQRPIQVKFFVDEKELDLIKRKMAQMGTDNMSAYLRKMAIDGYVVNLDMPELRELTSKMKRISSSENQIAKHLNTTGNIYEADIEEQIASGEYDEEVSEYYFSNPDPYAKVEPCPDDTPKRDIKFDENGNIVVKNLSAFWLPEVTIVDEIGNAEYTVTGSYEDNAKGKLNDDRFAMMSKTYKDERVQLKVEIAKLKKEIEVQERQIEGLEQFIQRARRYNDLTELTPYALRELVKAVYVEAPEKSSGKRKQRVHIEYALIGYIPVDELIKAEQA